jgi:hypothetical protein
MGCAGEGRKRRLPPPQFFPPLLLPSFSPNQRISTAPPLFSDASTLRRSSRGPPPLTQRFPPRSSRKTSHVDSFVRAPFSASYASQTPRMSTTTQTISNLASNLASTTLRGSSSPPLSSSPSPAGLKRAPLVPTGILDHLKKDLTPVIGSEFSSIQLPELLEEGNEEKLRELAILVSRRNVGALCSLILIGRRQCRWRRRRRHCACSLAVVIVDKPLTFLFSSSVFFKNQSRKLTNDEIKALANRLGEAAGRPEESGLHVHPTENSKQQPTLSPVSTSFTYVPRCSACRRRESGR